MGWGVWHSLISSTVWGEVGTGVAWLITGCLLLAGALGCLVPVVPGQLILLIAAVAHRLMLGPASGLRWWSFVVLATLMAVSQALEIASGATGTRWFGGTRWGAAGALLGTLIGLFFMPIGLLAGPLLGAILCELALARKKTGRAVISGVGSVVGTLAGMGVKIVIGGLMILWFFLAVFLIR